MQKGASARHLSPLGAWALAFGCALGWDSFVLPWTQFLPNAGPVGTLAGIVAGGAVMAAIAWNFHFMANRHPGPGGAYAYVTAAFGADRGFLCAWFLCFAYMAIVWLDATVLSYFIQHATGFDFRHGFHYSVAGHDVSAVHIAISAAIIAIAAGICCRRRLAGRVQTAIALLFATSIVACFAAALLRHEGGLQTMGPAFAPSGGRIAFQIAGIVAFSPWLFVGFESITNSSGEFAFPARKTFGVLLAAIAAVVAAYAMLSLIPTLIPSLTTGFHSWPGAVGNMGSPNDTAFGTIGRAFPSGGRIAVAVAFFASVFTNLVGNTVAASRLIAAMADDGALSAWFRRRNSDGAPANAVAAIALLALGIFFLGEVVIGIVVDTAIIGAALAYAYTSAATFKVARAECDRLSTATGLFGVIVSTALALLYVLPTFASHIATMATESYLVIICWCIAGLLTFLFAFKRDRNHRFGQSSVVWLAIFAIVLFLSVIWIRQSTFANTDRTFDEIVTLQRGAIDDGPAADALKAAVRSRQVEMVEAILHDDLVQTSLTILALALMLCLFHIMRQRERDMEEEKVRAKNYFFSTVSHDIRTPLNAIIGFSEMLKDGFRTDEEREHAINSVLVSGKTLLALINDVLDLSKLESGKMEILPEPTDCPPLLRGVLDAFRVASGNPEVELRCSAEEMPLLMLDPQRLRQIAFNLLGNAVKFTERGHIELRASFARASGAETGTFSLEVEDTGCGISDEDLKRIASPYVQVGSKAARNGGTGLGLAICRQLASTMGGKLEVTSTLGKGSTFSVTIPNVEVAQENLGVSAETRKTPGVSARAQNTGWRPRAGNGAVLPLRILLVDDLKMNLVLLKALLKKVGDFEIAMAADGNEALAALRAPGATPFDLVLTDMWMPNLDGEGLVKAIRADPALAALRVVVVTADVEVRGKFKAMGFDGVLLKPITTESLKKTLSGDA